MMDRYLLRYFLAVIDHGNFSKAAASCNVSQPTLSAGIAKLESLLHQKLFNRTNRRVELTNAGATLAAHARRIEAGFTSAERDVRGAETAPMVRLGVLVTIPTPWIEAFVARLQGSASGERVELVEGRERDLLERLDRGRIDVALTLLRADNRRMHSESLFREGYSLAVAAHHPLAGRDMVDAAELAADQMIVRRHCELLPETSRYFVARGVRPFFGARTTSEDLAIAYVRSGLGVTVMPDCFRAKGVDRVRLTEFGYTREIGLLYAPHADPDALRARRTISSLLQTIDLLSGAVAVAHDFASDLHRPPG